MSGEDEQTGGLLHGHERRGSGQFVWNWSIVSDQMWVHPVHAEIITLFWCFLLLMRVTHTLMSSC